MMEVCRSNSNSRAASFVGLSFFLWINCVGCELVGFERFVEPSGPWGRQPVVTEEDGGYSNVLIAVHPDIRIDPATLRENIMESFTEVSNHLFQLSNHTNYLREVKVLVPYGWTDEGYERSRLNETIDTARILIRNGTGSERGSPPSQAFVRHLSGCEDESEYIYLPVNCSRNHSGLDGRRISELWNELRGGCRRNCSDFDSLALVDKVDCNNRQQNDSIGITPPRNVTFRFIQPMDQLAVVIVDARENMKEDIKLQRLTSMFNTYLWHLFPSYARVGAIVMNTTVTMLDPCTKLWESPNFRELLILEERNATGNSSIGEAVRLAITLLSDVRSNIEGSFVLIMSDGTEDYMGPTLDDVQEDVAESGVIVASLPFSNDTSENIQLNYTFNVNYTASKLNEVIRIDDHNRFMKIYSVEGQVEQGKILGVSLSFESQDDVLLRIIGEDILALNTSYITEGRDTREYPSDDGTIIDIVIYDEKIQEIWIFSEITQNLSIEVYSAIIGPSNHHTTAAGRVTMRTVVESPSVNFTERGGINIRALIISDERPVVNATVWATVTLPDGDMLHVQLREANSDSNRFPSSVVYSVIFANFTTEGEYKVTIDAASEDRTCLTRDPYGTNVAGDCDYDLLPFRIITRSRFISVNGIPPSQIWDLVTENTYEWNIGKLTWTAPGEDFMTGTASYYDIRFSRNITVITFNFEQAEQVSPDTVIPGRPTQPNLAHSNESLDLNYTGLNGAVFYFAIRAIDLEGNVGTLSAPTKMEFRKPTFLSGSQPVPPGIPFHVITGIVGCVIILIVLMTAVLNLWKRKHTEGPVFIHLGPPEIAPVKWARPRSDDDKGMPVRECWEESI